MKLLYIIPFILLISCGKNEESSLDEQTRGDNTINTALNQNANQPKIIPLTQGELNEALIKGTLRGDVNAINKALNQGANVNIMDRDGNTPLMIAAIGNHIKVVDALLSRKDTGVNSFNFNNRALAIGNLGYLKVLESLLNHKDTDVNLADHNGITPLMLAVSVNNLKAVQLLWVSKGINVNAVDKWGNSAYNFVQTKEMELLLKRLSAS